MDKDVVCVHTHTHTHTHTQEYYSAFKKGNPVIFETWMNWEGIILTEISHMEKDKY